MTEERGAELHRRLVVWWYGSAVEGAELRGLWDDAFRRFDARLRAALAEAPDGTALVEGTPPDLLVRCFEAAADDYDRILAAFPYELPDGWHEC